MLINKDFVMLDYKADNKEDVIEKLSEKFFDHKRLESSDAYIKSVMEREELFPTCFDFGVAIPHGKDDTVVEPCLGFCRLEEPMQWCQDSPNKSKLIFLIAVPKTDEDDTHLRILSKLSRSIMHSDFREKLIDSKTEDEVVQIINEAVL